MKRIFVSAFVACSLFLSAQTSKRPDNWFNLDAQTDHVNGVSTERAYKELLKDKHSNTVIVGVLDSGVDYDHEDLRGVMWTNPGEIPGNGIDDDKNGYVDDIHGWNFIGGKDGRNVEHDNLEMTRLLRRMKPKFDGKTAADFSSKDDKEQLKYYEEIKADYTATRDKFESGYNQLKFIQDGLTGLNEKIKSKTGVEKVTLQDVEQFATEDKNDTKMKTIAVSILKNNDGSDLPGILEEVAEGAKQYKSYLDYALNMDYDPRNIVGDNYDDVNEKYYGNPDCNGPDSFHGTHVAGIIAASRGNGLGMDGVATDVRIMAVRCVPDGDERDKDVANAIRYAVDNGAQILNMSFGKKYSWNKKAVDDAVKYAESKGVLIVHAAGNDAANTDEQHNFPTKKFEKSGEAKNFVEVGALSWQPDEKIVASFSNYGKKSVDVFSPGVDIYSTTPKNGYKDASGTSMASPVTCGVAAVLKSYYPTLTPDQIKKILVKSSVKTYKGKKVVKPGTKDELVKFDKLSRSGGLVNLYEAVKMADKFSKTKT